MVEIVLGMVRMEPDFSWACPTLSSLEYLTTLSLGELFERWILDLNTWTTTSLNIGHFQRCQITLWLLKLCAPSALGVGLGDGDDDLDNVCITNRTMGLWNGHIELRRR